MSQLTLFPVAFPFPCRFRTEQSTLRRLAGHLQMHRLSVAMHRDPTLFRLN